MKKTNGVTYKYNLEMMRLVLLENTLKIILKIKNILNKKEKTRSKILYTIYKINRFHFIKKMKIKDFILNGIMMRL